MELRIKSLLWSHPEPCNLPFPFPFRCPQLQELCITFLSSAFTPLWLYSPPLIYSPACPPISTYSKFCHSSEPGSASTYFYNLFSASIPFHWYLWNILDNALTSFTFHLSWEMSHLQSLKNKQTLSNHAVKMATASRLSLYILFGGEVCLLLKWWLRALWVILINEGEFWVKRPQDTRVSQ